jgi:hypothetical protein
MFAEGDAWSRLPSILVDDDACGRWIIVGLMGVPANGTVTDDGG